MGPKRLLRSALSAAALTGTRGARHEGRSVDRGKGSDREEHNVWGGVGWLLSLHQRHQKGGGGAQVSRLQLHPQLLTNAVWHLT